MKCTKPHKIKVERNGKKQEILVKCNYCKACKINKITEWNIRIKAEMMERNDASSFLTLTYADETPNMSLIKNDLILFHKRLRKNLNLKNLKYLAIGEYGEKNERPHYHGIYLGLDGNKHLKEIQKIWGKGFVYNGSVTDASIRYVIEYIIDKKKDDEYKPRKAPFQLSSQGFGKNYFFREWETIFELGYVPYKGKKIPIPDYLKKIFRKENKNELERYQLSNYEIINNEQRDLILNHFTKEKRKKI